MRIGNIFDLLKRHYEKVLLALALIGLIGAVLYLNQVKNAENDKLANYEKDIPRRKSNPVPQVDVSILTEATKRANNPPAINFAPPHNLLNPVKWQQGGTDNRTVKVETGKEVGPEAMEVVKVTPLNLTITLDGPSGSGVNMSVFPETNRLVRAKIQSFVTTNSPADRVHRTRFFTLRDLKTAPEAIADIELADGTKATVKADQPFKRIEGYKADLKYTPENRNLNDMRVGDKLTLAGEDYNIVAINPTEIVVSARSNNRRFNIRNNAAQ